MADKKRRITSVDVAREAGLSRGTVSFVLNNTPGQSIPEATRQRVLRAAAKLGYTPYAPARTLRSGRSDVVLFVLPDWPQGPTMAALVDRAAQVLGQAGLTLITHVHAGHDDGLAQLWSALSPAAVFGMRPFSAAELEGMRRVHIPAVLPPAEQPGYDVGSTLWINGVGRLQARYLIGKGHERLAYVLPDDPRLVALGRGRAEGAMQACGEAGLPEPLVCKIGLDIESATMAVAGWQDAATAVCAYNDEVALAVLAGMRALGVSLPVIGADDIPAARFAVPSLTTVAQDSGEIGEHIAKALLRALNNADSDLGSMPSDVIRVVERDSA